MQGSDAGSAAWGGARLGGAWVGGARLGGARGSPRLTLFSSISVFSEGEGEKRGDEEHRCSKELAAAQPRPGSLSTHTHTHTHVHMYTHTHKHTDRMDIQPVQLECI